MSLHPEAWSWYVGALGEIEVGEILAELGPEWLILHSVPIGAGTTDVDHLVVGPNGVFTLNTKRHLNAQIWVGDHVLRVNNSNTHHLNAARHEAAEVCRRLSEKVGFTVPVYSAIVAVRERGIKDIRDPLARATTVVSSRDLIRWIRSQPATLSATSLALIRLAAEEPDTWHIDPHAADTLRVMARFQRLRADVGDNPASPNQRNAVRSRPGGRQAAPSRPPKRGRAVRLTKPHRSRAEKVFWKVFFVLVGLPVMLAVAIILIAEIAAALSR